MVFPRTEFGEEVHLKRVGEFRRRAEREVHVLPQHLRDVRARHLHAPRQIRLRHPQLLHPPENPSQKRRANSIYRLHRPSSYKPKSVFPNAANTRRLMNSPHTSASALRPYVATMFKNIRRFGVTSNVATVKVLPITNTQPPSNKLLKPLFFTPFYIHWMHTQTSNH